MGGEAEGRDTRAGGCGSEGEHPPVGCLEMKGGGDEEEGRRGREGPCRLHPGSAAERGVPSLVIGEEERLSLAVPPWPKA